MMRYRWKREILLQRHARIVNVMGTTVDELLNGNQENILVEYKEESVQLEVDCTVYEKRVICEIAAASRRSMYNNEFIIR